MPDEKKSNDHFDLPDTGKIEFNRYGEVRKAPRLVQHLFERIVPLFEDRDGGYTRIVKLDKHRLGDGTDLVLLELVGQEEGPQIGGGTSNRRKAADRRTAFAASIRKDAAAAETEEAPADEEDTATAVAEPVEEPAAEAPEAPEAETESEDAEKPAED